MGLLSGQQIGAGNYPIALLALTPAGYDFAALASNVNLWTAVQVKIEHRVGETSFAVWLALLEAAHKRALLSDDRKPIE